MQFVIDQTAIDNRTHLVIAVRKEEAAIEYRYGRVLFGNKAPIQVDLSCQEQPAGESVFFLIFTRKTSCDQFNFRGELFVPRMALRDGNAL